MEDNSERIIKEYIDKNCVNHILKNNIFQKITLFSKGRIYKCKIKSVYVIFKGEDIKTNKDDIYHEYKVGLILNEFRNILPNFVNTFGLCKINFENNIFNNMLRYLIVEYIDGHHVDDKLKLDDTFRILMQVSYTLRYAQVKVGFVHYNLHRGNVIIKKLKNDVILNYGDFHLQTNKIGVIIDFGRSYTHITKGHEVKHRYVLNKFNLFHDILSFIYSTFNDKYEYIVNDLFQFYGYMEWGSHKKFSKLLEDITFNNIMLIDRQPSDLYNFLHYKYNFNSLKQ